MMPNVSDLSLPRVLVGDDTFKHAVKAPPVGMFLVNTEHDWLEQWVVDHWEVVGQYASGTADDPLANFQLAAARGIGLGTAGGGGVSPAPGGSVTDPVSPYDSDCVIVQDPDPGAVGAGIIWLDSGSGVISIRNATNTAWVVLCQA